MTPVDKALWYIESHFASDLSLDDIAKNAGVSRFHLTRAFAVALGCPVMAYLKARRLSEAARTLAKSAPEIMTVALEAGYNSHEAFTRAFRDQFGITPEKLRSQGHLQNIELVEPAKMNQSILETVEPFRYVVPENPLLIAGIGQHYDCERSAGIPAQWQRFVPHLGTIPGQIGKTAYGVKCNSDSEGNFEYVCGIEVQDFSTVPSNWSRIRIPQQRYAVFLHSNHISTIRRTWATIWDKWLPQSEFEAVDAPHFELYGETFDGISGLGGVEIWLPITNANAR